MSFDVKNFVDQVSEISSRPTEETPEAELVALEKRYAEVVRMAGPFPNAIDYAALRTMERYADELRKKIASAKN